MLVCWSDSVSQKAAVNLITNKPKTNDPELCAGGGQPLANRGCEGSHFGKPQTLKAPKHSQTLWGGGAITTNLKARKHLSDHHKAIASSLSLTLARLNTCACFFQSQDCEKCLYWTLQPFNTCIPVIPHWKLHSCISHAQVIKLEQARFFYDYYWVFFYIQLGRRPN